MSVLIFLIPITLSLGLIGIFAFLWSLKAKQYEDLNGEASRILFDDAAQVRITTEDKKIPKNDE